MASKERDNNITTKERDRVEAYLMRIIARYFDKENVTNQESIESIINESLQRYKQYLMTEKHQFVFSLNNKTGHISLDIQMLNGEPAFDKNTAFNKDFGNAADTMVEGNDPRLSDQRAPLEHKHDISDVRGLEKRLTDLRPAYVDHVHKNTSILNMLIYTGTQAELDLIIIEELKVSLNHYLENILYYQKQEESLTKILTEPLYACRDKLNNLQGIAQNAADNMHNWLPEAMQYTTDQLKFFMNSRLYALNKYLTKSELQTLKDHFGKVFILKKEDTIALRNNSSILNVTYEEKEPQTERANYTDADVSADDIFDQFIVLDSSGTATWNANGLDDTMAESLNLNNIITETENTGQWTGCVSHDKYSDYTHRISLKSADSGDGFITIILSYDDETNDCLELVFRSCNSMSYGSLVYNFNKPGEYEISKWAAMQQYNGWSDNPEGFSVLIKKIGTVIKVWMKCGVQNPYDPVLGDITSSDMPIIDIDMKSYPSLQNLCKKFTRWGYGCCNQALCIYDNPWFKGIHIQAGEAEANTLINVYSSDSISISGITAAEIQDGVIKVSLEYEENGQAFSMPLPVYVENNKCRIIMQPRIDNTDLKIETYVSSKCPDVKGTIANIYNDKFVIANTSVNEYYNWENLCNIEDANKWNFVKSLLSFNGLSANQRYLINGKYDMVMDMIDPSVANIQTDVNGIECAVTDLPAFQDWDTNEPKIKNETNGISINNNFKMQLQESHILCMAVQEFDIKQLEDYFENPKIHYQIFCEQGVIT